MRIPRCENPATVFGFSMSEKVEAPAHSGAVGEKTPPRRNYRLELPRWWRFDITLQDGLWRCEILSRARGAALEQYGRYSGSEAGCSFIDDC
jgi:hypothetical protein